VAGDTKKFCDWLTVTKQTKQALGKKGGPRSDKEPAQNVGLLAIVAEKSRGVN